MQEQTSSYHIRSRESVALAAKLILVGLALGVITLVFVPLAAALAGCLVLWGALGSGFPAQASTPSSSPSQGETFCLRTLALNRFSSTPPWRDASRRGSALSAEPSGRGCRREPLRHPQASLRAA